MPNKIFDLSHQAPASENTSTPNPVAPADAVRAGWRTSVETHHAVELVPPMSRAELVELAADIKINGLISPIALWRASKDGQAQLLDGRSRLDAIEIALGGPVRVTSRTFRGCTVWGLEADDDDGDSTPVRDLLGNENCSLDAPAVIVLDPGIDPYAYVVATNLRRRHLSAEDRQKALIAYIAHAPEKIRSAARERGWRHPQDRGGCSRQGRGCGENSSRRVPDRQQRPQAAG